MNTIPSPGQGVTEEELKALEATVSRCLNSTGIIESYVPQYSDNIEEIDGLLKNALPRLIVAARRGLEAEAQSGAIERATEYLRNNGSMCIPSELSDGTELECRLRVTCENLTGAISQYVTVYRERGEWIGRAIDAEAERDTAVAALAVAETENLKFGDELRKALDMLGWDGYQNGVRLDSGHAFQLNIFLKARLRRYEHELRWRYQVEPWLKEGEERELPEVDDFVWLIAKVELSRNGKKFLYSAEMGSRNSRGIWRDVEGNPIELVVAWCELPPAPSVFLEAKNVAK